MSELDITKMEFSDEERSLLNEWLGDKIIISMIKGDKYPGNSLVEKIGWMEDVYQVVCSRSFANGGNERGFSLNELVFFGVHGNGISYEFQDEHGTILVLKGNAAIERLNVFIEHYMTTPPQEGSPMYNLFFTCGSVVDSPEKLFRSYNEAVELMKRRFFSVRGIHMSYAGTLKIPDSKEQLSLEYVERVGKKLTESVQIINRNLTNQRLKELYTWICDSGCSEEKARYFMLETFFFVTGELQNKYPEIKINSLDNSEIIKKIMESDYLYEIFDFFDQRLNGLMSSLKDPERNGHISDILYYIQHNLGEQLRLENIAVLFGYNSAYLGKIFKENVGESFNNYLDRARVDKAKELLLSSKLKVYEVAEKVGYKNVDYFHKKFLKYENMSPAAYRNKMLSSGSAC